MRVRTYDPFQQVERLLHTNASPGPAVPLDVVRSDSEIELFFDLPGVDADSIELTVDKRELTLSATRDFSPGDDKAVVRSERRHGTFSRSLLLAENLDTDLLEAEYSDGVLKVSIGVIAAAQPRRIEVSAGA